VLHFTFESAELCSSLHPRAMSEVFGFEKFPGWVHSGGTWFRSSPIFLCQLPLRLLVFDTGNHPGLKLKGWWQWVRVFPRVTLAVGFYLSAWPRRPG